MTQVANTEQNKTKTKKHPKNQHSALWFYIGYKYTGCYQRTDFCVYSGTSF